MELRKKANNSDIINQAFPDQNKGCPHTRDKYMLTISSMDASIVTARAKRITSGILHKRWFHGMVTIASGIDFCENP